MFGRIVPEYDVRWSPNHAKVVIDGIDPITGESNQVIVKDTDYLAWKHGELLQNAFPYVRAANRDFILMGLTEKGLDLYMAGKHSDKVKIDWSFQHTDSSFQLEHLSRIPS